MSFADALRGLVTEPAVAWGFLVAAALTLALTPVVRRLAVRFDLLDHGGDRPRIHREPIPRIGGLAIAVGILVPALVFLDLSGAILGIVIGIPLVAAIGLVDDVRGLSASVKLLAVMLVACVPVIGFDMTFDRIGLPFVGIIDFGPAAVPLTLLWIALVANLVNLIDGMDALAAGIVAIAAASFALLAVSFGRVEVAALAAIVCGATVGFLRHNYHPATIFMGDTGALTLGFVLGALAVEGVLKNAGDDRARRAAAHHGRADPRHVVRRRQAPEVRAPALGAGPEPLLPPVPAHRLLAAAHRRVPARVGRGARRLRDAAALRAAAAGSACGTPSHTILAGVVGLVRARRLGLDGLRAGDPQGAPLPPAPGRAAVEEEGAEAAVEEVLEATP